MIHVDLQCTHCGANLMDKDKLIDGHQSIEVLVEYKGKQGIMHLSSRYGSYKIETKIDIPDREIVRFICPHCKKDMRSSRKCYECGAPMVTFESTLGGFLRICSRRGCKKHSIEFVDLETEIRAFYEKYSTFFKGD